MTTDHAGLLSIGQLAERTGVGISTLRSWETRVGFPEPVRSRGGQRRYRPTDVALVEQVRWHREQGLSLEGAVEEVRRDQAVGADSLFADLRRRHPELDVIAVSARTMLALTWSIEDECLVRASHPLLLGCFQNHASYAAAGGRWRELARLATASVVFSDFEESAPGETPARVALPASSPLLNEWSLVCLDPQLSVVLVAWERPRVHQGGERVFEALLSTEKAVVEAAVAHLGGVAASAGVTWPAELALPASAEPTGSDARAVALLRRFAAYADARLR